MSHFVVYYPGMNRKEIFGYAIKSYIVGATMTVPGVSGGSMAMVLGIYDRIISSVPELLTKKFRSAFLFLLLCGGFGLVGAVSASPLMKYLLSSFYSIVMFFFIGAIAGSIPLIVKKSEINKSNWPCLFFSILGIAAVILIGNIPSDAVALGSSNIFWQILCGILVSIGFVLPGISTTYLLVVLGLYESIITCLSNLQFLPLIPLAGGVIIGVFLLTGLLKASMEKYPSVTFPIILGFMIGSIPEVFPPIETGWRLLVSVLTFALGFVLVCFVCREE